MRWHRKTTTKDQSPNVVTLHGLKEWPIEFASAHARQFYNQVTVELLKSSAWAGLR
jgi:hypothetical protein